MKTEDLYVEKKNSSAWLPFISNFYENKLIKDSLMTIFIADYYLLNRTRGNDNLLNKTHSEYL